MPRMGSQPAHQIGVHGVHLIPCIVSCMLQAPGALHRQTYMVCMSYTSFHASRG